MINRRNFLKQSVLFSTLPLLHLGANQNEKGENNPKENEKKQKEMIKIEFNDHSVCPLCSLGCRTIVKKESINNQISIQSIGPNPSDRMNTALLCTKGSNLKNYYDGSLPRIETPLLKLKDGKISKDGILTAISWEKAFDIMETKTKKALKNNGVDGIGAVISESLSLYESYALGKFFKAGLRSNNITNINNEVERNSFGLIQTLGIDGSNGTYDDINLCDNFISFDIDLNNDFEPLVSRLKNRKISNGNYRFINIFSKEDAIFGEADINLRIKPDSQIALFQFLINKVFQTITTEDFSYIENHIIFALFDQKILQNDDRLVQWEISFHTYKQYFEQFDLDYLAKNVKTKEEDLSSFLFKVRFLIDAFLKSDTKTLSYFDSKLDSLNLSTNIMIHSLHILAQKYAKEGSGILYLHSSKLTATAAVNSGTSSTRLPFGTFTKYKQHREKAESIWRLPEHTLNAQGSTNRFQTFQNYCNGTTKLLWILGTTNEELDPYKEYFKGIDDGFIVYSNTVYDDFVLEADLVLPTCTFFEKHIGYENSQREVILAKQQLEPYGKSTSELWQLVEFSKRFTLFDLWRGVKIDDEFGMKNILDQIEQFGYSSDTSLFEVLFYNKTAKKYKLSTENYFNPLELNSEVKGDKRSLIGSDGTLFEGYKIFLQRYLFDEFRLFGLGNGYDFVTFNEYSSDFYEKWPIIFNKETKYRFNANDDQYAKRLASRDGEILFYGKLGSKQLPFGDTQHIIDNNLKELKNRAKIFMEKKK